MSSACLELESILIIDTVCSQNTELVTYIYHQQLDPAVVACSFCESLCQELFVVNAGEFAEAVRSQFLNERIEYSKELEDTIANAAAADGMDMCTQIIT